MKPREIITDNLSKAGWSWGCVSALDAHGRTTWIADAHRDDGNRFVVQADEKLSAFVELEAAGNYARPCKIGKLKRRPRNAFKKKDRAIN